MSTMIQLTKADNNPINLIAGKFSYEAISGKVFVWQGDSVYQYAETNVHSGTMDAWSEDAHKVEVLEGHQEITQMLDKAGVETLTV